MAEENRLHFDALVVGGGISGAAALYYLAKKGLRAALLDADVERNLIKTVKREGFNLECGPNVMLLKPELLELIRELGAEDQLVYPRISNYKQMVFYEGKAVAVPKGPLAFLLSPILSTVSKFKMLRSLFQRIDRPKSDYTAYEFFSLLAGKDAAENLFDPVLLGIYGGDVRKLSAKSLFPALFEALSRGQNVVQFLKSRGSKPKIAVFKCGMNAFLERVKKNTRAEFIKADVLSLEKGVGGFYLSCSDGQTYSAKSVLIATSGSVSSTIANKLFPELSIALAELSYAPLAVLHFATEALPESFKDSFGVLVPSKYHTPFLGVMFNTALFPHLSEKGHLLTVCLGGVHHPEVVEAGDDILVNWACEGLKRFAGLERARILNVARWPRAIPQYNLGHAKLVELIKQCEKENPGLFFIGTEHGGIGIPDRVRLASMATAAINGPL